MPRTIRFHFDENCANSVANGLRLHGVNVTTTHEVGLIAATDEQQLEFARIDDRVLFTHDRDLLALHAAGVPHRGLAYCHPGGRTIGEQIQGLLLIWVLLDPIDMVGRIEFI